MMLAGLHLGLLPGRMLVVVFAITLAIIASLVWAVLVGDGHAAASFEREPYDLVVVCPSADYALRHLVTSSHRYEAAGVYVPPIVVGECGDPPTPGIVQVRGYLDQVSGYVQAVDGKYIDKIVHHQDDMTGVAYVVPLTTSRPRCMYAHVLGHIAGLGHTTAAGSVMSERCGPRYTYLPTSPPTERKP